MSSTELRRLVMDPSIDPQVTRMGIVTNRLIDMVNGNQPGRIWLHDDDGDQRAIHGSDGILPGDVLSSGNYPLWSRSAAGNHGRFQHSGGASDIATFQDAGATIPLIIGNTRFANNVDVDGTFNADGAATFNGAVTLGNAAGDAIQVTGTATFTPLATFTGGLTSVGPLTANGAVTLGDAAGDVITVTGTATFAEDVTLTKGLIVDTTTLVVDETNNRVGILTATPQAAAEVAATLYVTGAAAGYPTTGAGVLLYYTAGSGWLESRNVAGAAYVPFGFFSSDTTFYDGTSTAKLQINNTGVGFFNTAPVGQPAAGGAADGTLGSATTLVNSLRTGLRALGLFS